MWTTVDKEYTLIIKLNGIPVQITRRDGYRHPKILVKGKNIDWGINEKLKVFKYQDKLIFNFNGTQIFQLNPTQL